MKFHPSDIVPSHHLTTGANSHHRALLAAARIHKMKTPGKRPAKVENIEKSAVDLKSLLKAYAASKAQHRVLNPPPPEEEQEKAAATHPKYPYGQKCPVCGAPIVAATRGGADSKCACSNDHSGRRDVAIKCTDEEKKEMVPKTIAAFQFRNFDGNWDGVKQATWLERWLSMYAARDAAHQADPSKDALGTKLLGGPLSMGLSEAINNQAIMGKTPEQRAEAMHDAARDVKAESYPESLLRGLKSSPTYVGVGAAAGAGLPALMDKLHGQNFDADKALTGAGVGAAGGLGLAVLRPLIQRAILGNVSRKALHRGIKTKAENPTLTALPLGDMIGATAS